MIYLDNAATTKPDGQCLSKAEKYLYSEYYNPSALYAGGYNLHKEFAEARQNIVKLVADTENFTAIITSCGTEADNQAVFCGGRRGNVVTTLGEHSAVFASVNELKQRGIEVRFAPLNSDGSVKVEELIDFVDEKTSLVSVIHVNNETGAINDINAIADKVKAKNIHALFHSDGVQAYGKLAYKLNRNVDLYSVSAHKIGGIKGCGALIKRKNLSIKPYIYGGGQEDGLRSGTENVFGVNVFSFAAQKRASVLESALKHVRGLKDELSALLDKNIFKILSSENGSPYILTVSAVGLRGETVMHECEDKGLMIGTGSACSSNEKKRFSRVILACGYGEEIADGVLRISFSPENTLDEVRQAAEILNTTAKNRKIKMS